MTIENKNEQTMKPDASAHKPAENKAGESKPGQGVGGDKKPDQQQGQKPATTKP